jgi:hypothetical protein
LVGLAVVTVKIAGGLAIRICEATEIGDGASGFGIGTIGRGLSQLAESDAKAGADQFSIV